MLILCRWPAGASPAPSAAVETVLCWWLSEHKVNTKPAAEARATCVDVGPKGLRWLKEQIGAHPNITSLHCQCFLQRIPGLWEQLCHSQNLGSSLCSKVKMYLVGRFVLCEGDRVVSSDNLIQNVLGWHWTQRLVLASLHVKRRRQLYRSVNFPIIELMNRVAWKRFFIIPSSICSEIWTY